MASLQPKQSYFYLRMSLPCFHKHTSKGKSQHRHQIMAAASIYNSTAQRRQYAAEK